MGMYSDFLEQNREDAMIDKDAMPPEDYKFLVDSGILDEDGETIDFNEWSGRKLEGYWYPETIKVLDLISLYIRDDKKLVATFMYEEGYKFKIILQKNKPPYYQEEEKVKYKPSFEINREGKMWQQRLSELNLPDVKKYSLNPKGWHKEPVNHALASKGIKVGKSRVKR